jgi:hypothetical protein
MQPTPIKPLNVFFYVVAGLVIIAFLAGTLTYFVAGQNASATAGKIGAGVGAALGFVFGLTRRFQ